MGFTSDDDVREQRSLEETKSVTRAGRSQSKELQKTGRGDPIMDVLLDRELFGQ